MTLSLTLLPLLPLLSMFFLPSETVDFNYPAVFNFGDSNSDTGCLVAGTGETLVLPNGQNYFGEPSGRFCDGRLIIDFLMDAMDLPFVSAYLDSLGAPNFHKGCNFAAAGATVLPATAPSACPFSFGMQVAQFFRFKARVLDLLARGRRLDSLLPFEEYFTQGLYMFDVGQNDLTNAASSQSEDQVVAFIPDILAEFERGITKLYYQGARQIWIHNTGPFGCLPGSIASVGNDPYKLDELGCVSSHNRIVKIFNLQLHALCRRLQGQLVDASITYTDIFTIKLDLISNYSKYGFKQPIMACCGYGGPPVNYDGEIFCGTTKLLNGSLVTFNVCDDSADYVMWDGVHYTEAANQHVASQILTGKYSELLLTVKVALS